MLSFIVFHDLNIEHFQSGITSMSCDHASVQERCACLAVSFRLAYDVLA